MWLTNNFFGNVKKKKRKNMNEKYAKLICTCLKLFMMRT